MTNTATTWRAKAVAAGVAVALATSATFDSAHAVARKVIRDAEIEALLRTYTTPIFKAAGLAPSAVDVILVEDSSINAFVSGGQRIFIHTGLLTEADTPNEVIGVLAHEAGHIAGGHLARSREELDRASITSIIAALAGAAAIAGGVMSGNSEIGGAGTGIISAGQESARRNFLRYAREQESAADQAAMRYLDATGQSAKGMLRLFERLADQMLVSVTNVDPYIQSHPLPRERITLLRRMAEASPYYDVADPPDLVLRHELMRAKLYAYLGRPSAVANRYGDDPDSAPAIYARAITYFKGGDMDRSIAEIDRLIAAHPNYPYFHELKGQALLESGRAEQSIPILQHAVELAPDAPLIRILLAQALVTTNDQRYLQSAVDHLSHALVTERRSSSGYRLLAIAYDRLGDTARAELASANEYVVRGDLEQAKHMAQRAKEKFRRGSSEWQIADDIENIRAN